MASTPSFYPSLMQLFNLLFMVIKSRHSWPIEQSINILLNAVILKPINITFRWPDGVRMEHSAEAISKLITRDNILQLWYAIFWDAMVFESHDLVIGNENKSNICARI